MLIRIPLLLAFPLLTHLAVELHRPWLQCAALGCAYAGLFFTPLAAGSLKAWGGLAAFAAVDLLLLRLGGGALILYLPSLIVPALVLSAFAPTLLPGRTPFITRIAEAQNGPMSPQQQRYTRGVTWVWSVTLVLILCITLGLLLSGAIHAWSVFANFLSYLLLGVLFAGEYLVRRVRFPERTPRSFAAFLRSLSSYRPH